MNGPGTARWMRGPRWMVWFVRVLIILSAVVFTTDAIQRRGVTVGAVSSIGDIAFAWIYVFAHGLLDAGKPRNWPLLLVVYPWAWVSIAAAETRFSLPVLLPFCIVLGVLSVFLARLQPGQRTTRQ
jgi:hypothetical protein